MYYAIFVTQYKKMLGQLDIMLDKAVEHAESKKFDVDVLLNSRLAPDQFNFIRQVQITCDTAKFGAARLSGKIAEVPTHPDTEKTVAELKARIKSVQEYLNTYSESDFSGADKQVVNNKWWDGKHMEGYDFAIQHSLPNLYFHLTTAYSILRHNGVVLGKGDFLGPVSLKS